MRLTGCPDCQEAVSVAAAACPHCGRVMRPGELATEAQHQRRASRNIVIVLGLVVLAIFIFTQLQRVLK